MQNFEARNYRIDNVEINWAKLAKPVNPFGTEQWEIQIATTDKAIADQWSADHFNVKTDKNDSSKFTVSLKRKAYKADGTANGPVRVVGKDTQAIADPSTIGNGSIGNVIVYQYPYSTAGREGIASSLTAVQIVSLNEYTPAVDFEPIVDAPASNDSPSNEMPF
tara:strand:+ start:3238 stop:3729 length:492 start_codon:yes stop_codon:yes gene_type:complete